MTVVPLQPRDGGAGQSRGRRAPRGLVAKQRILAAVLCAEARVEFGRTGLGLIGNVAEPLADIGVLVLWHYSIRVLPIYGTSIVLFVSTGVLPTFIFIHLSSKFLVVTQVRKEHFRGIELLDIMAAKAVITTAIYILVGTLLFSGESLWVTPQAVPFRLACVMLAVASLVCLGTGMALVNAVVGAMVPLWRYAWGGVSRMFILFGGILYVPDLLPPSLRQLVAWNPALQAVELFRQGFYPNFPTLIFSPVYLALTSLGLLALGFCLQRATKDFVRRFKLLEL